MKSTWEEIKSRIKPKLPKNSFSLWISPITFVTRKNKTIVLGCPNKFSCKWVTENYSELIQNNFDNLLGEHVDLIFKVEYRNRESLYPALESESKQLVLPNSRQNKRCGTLNLNKNFVFDRFVVGPSNEFAYSASNAFAHGERWNYSTLLMLADTGLGKTHLSQAVGNHVLEQNPRSRVYYVTAEDFMNEMVFSLKNNRIETFKDRYRRLCDVLLLEEVHFLSGKEKTQTELGYTLDALINDKKKVIFTSSLPPKDIPKMSKELSSRLTSGLITTIDIPDYETRVKILLRKSAEQNLSISEEIICFLASSLRHDVRQMESVLNCLKARAEFLDAKIDIGLAKDVVKSIIPDRMSVTLEQIKELIVKYYKVEAEMLSSKSRKKIHTHPRNIYVYLCRSHTTEPFEKIAKTVNRSHSAVIYAYELVEHKMKTDTRMKRQIELLSQKIEEMKNDKIPLNAY